MTLEQAYNGRSDLRLVAFREGTLTYVPLGYDSYEVAIDCVDLTQEDLNSNDWLIGEVVSNELGQATSFTVS